MGSKWIPHEPTEKQTAFLLSSEKEVFFGGAAGGGKSDALLMAALMFVDLPEYAAIIFRRTYPELSLPGGLLERAADWLGGTDARWNGNTKTWTFPSGATLSFGHMENENDKFNYKSSEFTFIGFDELTSFTETQYLYLFSRLRRTEDNPVSLRMRSASNPGDIGHAWVKKRFVHPDKPSETRRFIPSLLQDNPYLNEAEYTATLMELDKFTRDQLLKGIWTDSKGNHFFPSLWPRHKFRGDAWSVGEPPSRQIFIPADLTILMGIDIATKEKKTSDFTAFIVAGLTRDRRLLILEVINERMRLENVAKRLSEFCERWTPHIVASDDDTLSASMLLHYRTFRNIPEVRLLPIQGRAKVIRAAPAMVYGENGRIYLPDSAPWVEDFSDQLSAFTGIQEEHDDMVDALGLIARLANQINPGANRVEQGPMVLVEGRNIW
jgi:predicted phage terminase large subunit-like protein